MEVGVLIPQVLLFKIQSVVPNCGENRRSEVCPTPRGVNPISASAIIRSAKNRTPKLSKSTQEVSAPH
jgi:hypothetical protein